jgi:hypothetical protein
MALEAAEGEESGLSHYDHALSADFPADLRNMLETQQRSAIKRAVDDLRVGLKAGVH